MNLFIRLAIYMLLISTFDSTLTIPIRDKKDSLIRTKSIQFLSTANGFNKIRRQVVQPGWTPDMGIGELFQDLNVRVTDQKLEETEAIREDINDTVQDGTYVVELDKSDYEEGEPGSEFVPEPEAEPEAAPELEPAPEPEPEPEPAPAPEPEPETKPEQIAKPKLVPVLKPALQPKSKSEMKPKKTSKGEKVGTHFFAWFKKFCLFKTKCNH